MKVSADVDHADVPYVLCRVVCCRCLDKAAVSGPGPLVSRTVVEETKAFLGIMPLFLCICIYQMAYDPIL